MLSSIQLSQKLIQIPSYSGNNPEVINFLKDYLEKLNFKCEILEFEGDDSYKVNNLHAVFNPNNSDKILYFAGHTDVVKEGDKKAWKYDPFSATIDGDKLYGRGTADMKCAIASFVIATQKFIQENNPNFGIGFLITNDEENDSINGTEKCLKWMQSHGHKISACIVGEPTNPEKLGEMVKIGRRGSINFSIEITGKQGHVAYAENALNPTTILINLLKILKDHKFDNGNEFFSPTNLEITSMQSDNFGNNVIPQKARANINVRFNSLHNAQAIIDLVEYACKKTVGLGEKFSAKYELTHRKSGESFLSKAGNFAKITQNAVKEVTGLTPTLGTTGGTSDARFIKDYCAEIIECGLINKTAHQIDEFSYLKDIEDLEKIYFKILKTYA